MGKSTVFFIALLILLCLPKSLWAADLISLRGGPTVTTGNPDGSSKYFGIRAEQTEERGLSSAQELGGWVDSRQGHSAAAVLKCQWGVVPGPERGLFGRAFLGPAIISHRDALLGSFMQFATDIGFGVRDVNSSMSVEYSHISNAGLFGLPNQGRDFLVFSLGLSF